VWLIPTDEERVIAAQLWRLLQGVYPPHSL
jgi:acetate kinase